MINQISILSSIILLMTLASIFTVLMVTILKLLRQAKFFAGATAVVMAIALSILFVVVSFYRIVFPVKGSGNEMIAATGFFSLRGIALAVATATVLSQVMFLTGRVPLSEEPSTNDQNTQAKETEHSPTKPKSRGRPKKDRPIDTPSRDMTKRPSNASRAENEKASPD